jgi:hypothetical protein
MLLLKIKFLAANNEIMALKYFTRIAAPIQEIELL